MAMTTSERTAMYRATRSFEQHHNELLKKAAWRIANPRAGLRQMLGKKFGMTLECYDNLHAAQGGACALCAKAIAKATTGAAVVDTACVDHCHSSGRVRGLLCAHCNKGLGLFKDNRETLMRAIKYLEAAI